MTLHSASVRCQSPVSTAFIYSVPSALLAALVVTVDMNCSSCGASIGVADIHESHMWVMTTGLIGILLLCRLAQTSWRWWEAVGLMHQMRGEWSASTRCLVAYSRLALGSKRVEVLQFRHTLIRLMSLCHGSALDELQQRPGAASSETLDLAGLDAQTLKYLQDCHNSKINRLDVVYQMIHVLVVQACEDGVLKVAPQILSHVHQNLSRGFVNFANARKILACQPCQNRLVQLNNTLLFFHMILTPVLVALAVRQLVLAAAISFVSVFAGFCLSCIAADLDRPFGQNDADISLYDFQDEFNVHLVLLLRDQSDHVARTTESCLSDDGVSFSVGFRNGALEKAESGDHGANKARSRALTITTGGLTSLGDVDSPVVRPLPDSPVFGRGDKPDTTSWARQFSGESASSKGIADAAHLESPPLLGFKAEQRRLEPVSEIAVMDSPLKHSLSEALTFMVSSPHSQQSQGSSNSDFSFSPASRPQALGDFYENIDKLALIAQRQAKLLNHNTEVMECLTATVDKLPVALTDRQADDVASVSVLEYKLDEFNKSFADWSKAAAGQSDVMSQNSDALRGLCQAIPSLSNGNALLREPSSTSSAPVQWV